MERLVDYWITPKSEIAVTTEPIFQKIWKNTGKDDFDEQFSRLIGPETGFPLRSEIRQNRTDKKGEKSSTEIVQFIKTLKEIEDLSEDVFQAPDCDEVGAKKVEKKFKALLKDLVG